jgi:hypothetical protein
MFLYKYMPNPISRKGKILPQNNSYLVCEEPSGPCRRFFFVILISFGPLHRKTPIESSGPDIAQGVAFSETKILLFSIVTGEGNQICPVVPQNRC